LSDVFQDGVDILDIPGLAPTHRSAAIGPAKVRRHARGHDSPCAGMSGSVRRTGRGTQNGFWTG